jgi:ferric-dicitrate binding protein FerR (iron transport regulator)
MTAGKMQVLLGSPTHHRRTVLIAAACLSAGMLFALSSALAADPAGDVAEIKGEAFADTGQQHRALEKTSPVYLADRVSTGAESRLALHLGSDTTVRLGEKSQLVIDQFLVDTGGEISLQSGPMLFERPEGARRIPVKIRSPYAVIAVRGTTFFAGPSNGVFGVFVESGSVEVSGAGTTVTLTAGQGTNLQSPGAAPTPPVNWGEARIRAALESVR